MDQQNLAQVQPPQGLMNEQQKNNLISDLGLDSLPEDQRNAFLANMVDTVLNRVFLRVSQVLTEQDLQMLDTLQQGPNPDQAVNQFLASRIPTFNSIVDEEIATLKEEMKTAVEAMKTTLPQQAQQD